MKKWLAKWGVHYGRFATAWELQVGKLWLRIPYKEYRKCGSRVTLIWVQEDEE